MHTLPHSLMLPAPGQGALAIECRARDKRVRSLLQTIHNERVSACVTAERSALQTLGGGCHLPLGALAEIRGKRLHLSVAFGLPDGTHLIRTGGSMPLSCPRELGRTVARILLANEGKEILEKLTLPGT